MPFFTISGSDFVEMFVGVGASRVRDMFEQAKKNAPCIIFIDEIDAVGRHRGAGLGGGNDEREQTLNQLLVEMDGFEANEGIILIAATNRPDVLDPALLRPGRFDRQVVVPNPDVVGREQILKVHVRKVPLAPDVNLRTIARGTPGFSGADLMNLVNEAALMAARRNKRMVTQVEFEDAKDKVMMGAERKSLVMTEEEKLLTAYHEGGHAIVALNVKATDPVHKATIIPRGRALGMVMQLPERDKLSMSLEQMTSRLAIMMGGRVAEELVFGRERVTSGAASDIEQATKLARMMVTRWGLSDALGTVAYGENQEEVFLGYSVARQQNISEATVQKIDAEIRRLVEAGYQEAQQILTDKRADLETLAKGLLEFETLTGDEIKDLLMGKRPNRETIIEPFDAAKLDGADRRRRPQPAASRARADGAAAAGLRFTTGGPMRPIAIASVVLALAAGPAAAQTAGQPLVTVKPKAASAKPPNPAKPPHVAKPASTPEGRSAAALALSAEPVFDEGTYQRLKEALLSYSAIQVRGGWPSLAADAQLAPGGSGPSVALLRRRLAITEDLGAEREAGDSLRRRRRRSRQAVPIAPWAGADRQRQRADTARAQCPGRGAHQAARSFAGASARHGFHLRRALCRGEYSGRLRRGGRPRQGRAALSRHRRQGRQAVADAHRLHHRDQSQSDLDGAAFHHQKRNLRPHAQGPKLYQPHAHARPRRPRRRYQSAIDRLVVGPLAQLHHPPGFRQLERARQSQDRHAQSVFGVYARHRRRAICSPTTTASIRTAARGSTMCAISPPGYWTTCRAGIAPRSMPASPPACSR